MQLFQKLIGNRSIRRKSSLFPSLALLALTLVMSQPIQASTTELQARDHHHARITNENTGIHYNSLQTAIDDASAGDTLRVSGKNIGPFFIDKNLTLIGGHDAVLDGEGTVRVLDIGSVVTGQAVTLKNITIRNGFATDGAGILNAGDLTLINCTVIYNTATSGGGGGIENINNPRLPSTGYLTLIGSKVFHNTAVTFGGGIESTAGRLVIRNSKVKFNTCTGTGGGIFTTLQTDDSFTDSEIRSNLASTGAGGGFATVASITVITNVNFKWNVGGAAGAIFNELGTVTLNNAWIHKNQAVTNGGGILNEDGGTVTLNHCKVHKNEAVQGTGGGILYFQGSTLIINESSVEKNSPNDIVELPAPV